MHLLKWSCVFFPSIFWCGLSHWFKDSEKSLIPWVKSHCLWCMILLMYCWIQIPSILLRIYAPVFISDFALWFSFFCDMFGFCVKVMMDSQNEFDSFLSSAIFWNSFRRIIVSSSWNLPVKSSGPGLLFVGSF